jgi:hypothetical protein
MRKINTIVSKTEPQAGKAVTDTLPADFLVLAWIGPGGDQITPKTMGDLAAGGWEYALIVNRTPFEPSHTTFHFGTDSAVEELSPESGQSQSLRPIRSAKDASELPARPGPPLSLQTRHPYHLKRCPSKFKPTTKKKYHINNESCCCSKSRRNCHS